MDYALIFGIGVFCGMIVLLIIANRTGGDY